MQISGKGKQNDYSPILLTGKAAQRILSMMEQSTGTPMPPMGTEGSVIRVEMAR